MRILDKFEVHPTGKRERDAFEKPVSFSAVTKIEKGTCSCTPPLSEQYELGLKLAVRFIANEAEYERAVENARKQVQHNLYADVLRELQQCRSAIYEGDKEAALDRILYIETEIISVR